MSGLTSPLLHNARRFHTIGNHEGPTYGGTDKLIWDYYPTMHRNWKMPARYYSVRALLHQGRAASLFETMLRIAPSPLRSPPFGMTSLRPVLLLPRPQVNVIGNGVFVKILNLNLFPCVTGAVASTRVALTEMLMPPPRLWLYEADDDA